MLSPRKIRILGVVLILVGLILSGSMGWLIVWLQGVIANPGEKGRWSGGPEFTTATFNLFHSVLFFGATSLIAGLFQAITARRSKLVLAPIMLALGWLAYSLWSLLSLKNTL